MVAQYAVYTFLYMVMGAVSFMLAVIWWENDVACSISLGFQLISPIWNGGQFYVSVLAPKNFDPNDY